MTMDQEQMTAPKSGLNPNAEAFEYSGADVHAVSQKIKFAINSEALPNGDVQTNDVENQILVTESSEVSVGAATMETVDIGSKPKAESAHEIEGTPAEDDQVHNSSAQTKEQEQDKEFDQTNSSQETLTVAPEDVKSDGVLKKDTEDVKAEPDSVEKVQLEGAVAAVGNAEMPTSNEKAAVNPTASADLDSVRHELLQDLRKQCEFYFSAANLENDGFLRSQMDEDGYVDIKILANFKKVQSLTVELSLLMDAVKSSLCLQVDSGGTKVRARTDRSVLLIREIPEDTSKEDVEALFDHEDCPKVVSCHFAHNDHWYVMFETEQDAQDAFSYLQAYQVKYNEKQVLARFKQRTAFRPANADVYTSSNDIGGVQQRNGSRYNSRVQQQTFNVVNNQFYGQQQHHAVSQYSQLFGAQQVLPMAGASAQPSHVDPAGGLVQANGFSCAATCPVHYFSPTFFTNTRRMGNQRRQLGNSDPAAYSRSRTTSCLPAARSFPRVSHIPSFERTRNESAAGHNNSQGAVGGATMSKVFDGGPHVSKPDLASVATQPKRNNFKRWRRNDDGLRNVRPNGSSGNKDNNSSSCEAPDVKALSTAATTVLTTGPSLSDGISTAPFTSTVTTMTRVAATTMASVTPSSAVTSISNSPSKTSNVTLVPATVELCSITPTNSTVSAPKPGTECSTTQTTTSTSSHVLASAPVVNSVHNYSTQGAKPKLSYAQMAAKKHKKKTSEEDGASSQATTVATTATPVAVSEPTHTNTATAVSHAAPKSAAPDVQPSSKWCRDNDPREQRHLKNRRHKDNRENRQPRVDSRRNGDSRRNTYNS